jgi:hypothetical protein
MKLIIGCPIYKRDWIFPAWASCIENQSVDLSDIGFVFVGSKDDVSTISLIERWKSYHPEIKLFDFVIAEDVNHIAHEEGSRQWTISKYENMVNLRNILLNKVREYQPDYFLSLDSDILLTNPSTIELLIAHIKDGADAVSPLMFMTPIGTRFPSVMKWINEPGKKAMREDYVPLGTYFQSDVIMAAKMMSKEVYNNVNYKIHEQGEDLGWSANCAEKGYKLFSASYIYAPHIMGKAMFEDFKKNNDPRSEITLKPLSKV